MIESNISIYRLPYQATPPLNPFTPAPSLSRPMLPSPPSTNYSRAYIRPLVYNRKSRATFLYPVGPPRSHFPNSTSSCLSRHPMFPICFFFFYHHLPCFRVSHLLSQFFFFCTCNHRVCFSSLLVTPATSLDDISALSSTAYSSDLGCLTACSSPNAPPELPFNRQPSCKIPI